MVSGGLGRTDYGNQFVIGGMSRQFFERLGQHYGEPISWFFEPGVAERTYRDWLKEAGVAVLYEHRLGKLEKDGRRIMAIRMENGAEFEAAIFIDASYEGDILPRAGISYTWGREGQDVYGESLAGRREYSKYHQFNVPVSPYDNQGRLLPLIYGGDPGIPGQGDGKVQAYNFRICLCNRPENQVPFPRPAGYDPARYEILKRYLAQMPDLKMDDLMIVSMMPNGKTDVNNRGPVSTDHIGANWDYPEADYARRAAIWEDHISYVQGFLYFLANDPSVPEPLRKEMNTWGLAKDEFTDTGHWPHQLYVREAKRMVGQYVVQQKDLQTDRTKAESIGMGSYNSDSHHVQRIPVIHAPDWDEGLHGCLNEGDMQVPVEPYEIPYRVIVPQGGECENLLVPVCFSATHVSYSSLRMEPQYMILGEAAGLAAALAIAADCPVQDIDVPALQAQLRANGGVLSASESKSPSVSADALPGIVVDNVNASTTGTWYSSTNVVPFVGYNYLHDAGEDKGQRSVRYVPDLPKAGRYEVRAYYCPHPNRATNVPVTIHSADGTTTVTINQRHAAGDGETFRSLGTYRFPAGTASWVEIGNGNTDGHVVADAIQWIAVEGS